MIKKDYKYVADLVQNSIMDFAQMRHDPVLFKFNNTILAVVPVLWRHHPAFINDLARLLLTYSEVFKKLEFLSLEAMKQKNIVSKMIHQITIFSNTIQYKMFVKKGLPRFIIKWAKTVNKKQNKFIKISKRKADKILDAFTIDELLKIFMYIFAFNYDAVKKNNWDLLQKVLPLMASTQNQKDMTSSGSTRKPLAEILPAFSMQPFSKSDSKLIAQQSMMTSK